MASLFRPTYTDKKTGEPRKAKKWYGQFTDGGGVTRRVPLSANKAAAQQMLNDLVRRAELEKVGIRDPFADHRRRPLADHLADWERSLRAGGASDKHVRQTVACARKVVAGCGFVRPPDLSASRVQSFLAGLRGAVPGPRPLDPAVESYTRAELAAALGVKPSAVPSLVARHRLGAAGSGKARRYPKATAETLLALRAAGRGAKTANQYLAAVKQFARWLVLDRRMADNPLAHLSGANARTDRRRDRRPLSAGELGAVTRAASASRETVRGLSGTDRAVLYAVAAGTGFRAGELASLTPGAFDLDATPPTVTLAAEHAKNGRAAVQPLPAHLAADLRGYLAGRPAGVPVWPGTWHERAADVMRVDLDAAGIPYVVDGPDGRRYADFHSLRHTYIALLDKAGATLKEAMQLARHSDPRLTMAVYGRAQLHDLGAAVGRLPALATDPTGDVQAATTTDTACTPACTDLARAAGSGREKVVAVEGSTGPEPGNTAGPNPLEVKAVGAGCNSVGANDPSSASRIRTYNPPVNRRVAKALENPPNDLFSRGILPFNGSCGKCDSMRGMPGFVDFPHRSVEELWKAATVHGRVLRPPGWGRVRGLAGANGPRRPRWRSGGRVSSPSTAQRDVPSVPACKSQSA
jgi:integrase